MYSHVHCAFSSLSALPDIRRRIFEVVNLPRLLIVIGITLVAVGLLWPWLAKLGLGRLPGDIIIERENGRFYFPLTTSVIISIILSLLFWLLRK